MQQVRAAAQSRTLGRFTLIERLGAGGQGEVWRAHDESRGIDIALKILSPALARSPGAWAALEREQAIADRLQHPAILRVMPPERFGEVVALPMELASGGDLRRLRGAGYLEIVPVLIEVAEALDYAHERGVVHRDLKPGNVLFDSRGRAKLADFGVAGLLTSCGAAGVPKRPAGLSPFSASPQQLRGEPPTPADDIYGFGALAYELLCGHPPHYPHFDPGRAQSERVPELAPTRQIPPELGRLVMRMLAKRAADRPPSMSQVLDELDGTLNATLSYEPELLATIDAESADPAPAAVPPRSADDSPAPAPPAAASPPPAPQRWEPAPAAPLPMEPGAPAEVRQSAPASMRPAAPAPMEPAAAASVKPAVSAPTRTAALAARAAVPAGPAAPVSIRPPAPAPPASTPPAPAPSASTPSASTPSASTPSAASPQPGPVAEATPSAPVIARGERMAVTEPVDLAFEHDALRISARPPRAAPPARPRSAGSRPRRWPYLISGLLVGAALICAAAAAALFLLPREDLGRLQTVMARLAPAPLQRATASAPAPTPARAEPKPAATPADAAQLARLDAARAAFNQQFAALNSRGAAIWDGADFSAARLAAAEASGAEKAGGIALAHQQLERARRLLARVEARSAGAFAAELARGNRAMSAGHQRRAAQAFALAHRIEPGSRRAIDGARRARLLPGVLPLLADAHRAELAGNYSRAAQDFSQALALDPRNTVAKAGLARANAAFGNDNYARAVGAGYAALGAGRLDEARSDFQQALTYRSRGSEATAGLARARAAMQAGRVATLRQEAARLEQQEHWNQALEVYRLALGENPSLAFARRGVARAAARARLGSELAQMIEHPSRLALPLVRVQAMTLLQNARMQNPSGPVLQSQIERLTRLLPQFSHAVPLNLVSDDATQVAIPSIGVFGAFARREIRLMPGTYTIIGTREGYRDVRREFTVLPGDRNMTITVSCSEPI